MIKANELRVGNWIQRRGKPIQIISIQTIGTKGYIITATYQGLGSEYISDDDQLQPIPLTRELLEEAGFEKVNNGIGLRVLEGYVYISSLFTGFPLTLDIDGNRMPLREIKYLHQLHNLYFSLTNQELTIHL
jgi:hypothetical protein